MRYLITFISVILLMVGFVTCKKIWRSFEESSRIPNNNKGISLNKAVKLLLKHKRKNDHDTAPNLPLYQALTISARKQNMGAKDPDDIDLTGGQATLIESELINALAHKKSALFDKPYVEQLGRNDFLVIQPDHRDPFVTVIPNNIYYNIEKGCVNWLDDCNLRGVRSRLLRGVQSPFKK